MGGKGTKSEHELRSLESSKKSIGIYTIVSPSRKGGVGRRLNGLLRSLQTIDGYNEYTVYSTSSKESLFPVDASNFHVTSCSASAQVRLINHLYQSLLLPVRSLRDGLDVLHIPNTTPLIYSLCPVVVTIHDLTEFALSQKTYGPIRNSYRKLANLLAARNAKAIITVSEDAKRDIVQFLDIDPSKVNVVYPGVDEMFRPFYLSDLEKAHLRKKYDIPQRFILFVGQLQPRKNLVRLLKAFGEINRKYPEYKLVLVGKQGWMYDKIYETMEEMDLEDSVVFTGYVEDADLPMIYSLSELFVFPSLYEGFGFPVLEAMACGTPVITSNRSSLAEIARGAAVLVDPLDVREIAEAIDHILSDLAIQNDLRTRGLNLAEQFTWEKCAKQTVDVYQYASRK